MISLTLNPYWLTGFLDGEGCFHVSFTKRVNRKIKIEVRPSFSVTQLPQSRYLLLDFEKFFKCGAIRFSKIDGLYKYEVRSVSDLNEKILPHFMKYPLVSPKKHDFDSFREICQLLKENRDKNPEMLRHILELAFLMNSPGKRKYSKKELLKLIAS